jgi:hypothetical protein
MTIDEILKRRQVLQIELDDLAVEVSKAKNQVLEQIRGYIKEFNISLAEVKNLYVVQPTKRKRTEVDRTKYPYYSAKLNKWFNGYQKIPGWFDLSRADEYLVNGKKHTSYIANALAKAKPKKAS